jgi:DNA-binding NarL/FixJ family response regulator
MTPLKTRILLADDHAVVRRGLRMVLEAEPDMEVVAEAGDGITALQIALKDQADLAIFDVAMPRMTGLHAARELHRLRPNLRILSTVERHRANILSKLGMRGCVDLTRYAIRRGMVEP